MPRRGSGAVALVLLTVVCTFTSGTEAAGSAEDSGSPAQGVRVLVDPQSAHVQAPHSFLGFSHEPLTIAKHVLPTPQYRNFIKLLSSFDTGPLIIRWGGNEQDLLLEPLDDEQWSSMQDLHELTGVRYMIGLNLKAKDPQLAVTQVTNAMRFLPPASVLAFNIGNEADAFTWRDPKRFPPDYWRNGWFTDVAAYCEAIAPILMRYFNHTKLISGPGSSDMTMWRDAQVQKFAGKPPLSQYASMLTTHYYTYRSTSPGASYTTFLAEPKLDVVHRRVLPWVRYARQNRLHFRLEETNTLAISGLAGASDTLAAALFYIDYAMTMIKAGVGGMNFHDSLCSAYSPIIFPSLCIPNTTAHARGTCVDICGQPGLPPMLRAPYYGMLFIQMALAQLPKLLVGVQVERDRSAANVKAHVLSVAGGEELRIVLVKKDGDEEAEVTVTVTGDYGPGSLSLLQGPSFTSYFPDITLAGQKVTDLGELHGERKVQEIDVDPSSPPGSSQYTVVLPAASAGLLIVRPIVE